MVADKAKGPGPSPREVSAAIHELEEFMKSEEGAAAMELLKATGRHIILCETEPQAGTVSVFFLNGKGLQQSIEAGGMSSAYSTPREPRVSPILADSAVKAATHPEIGGRKPADVLPFLRGELDKIAEGIKKR